MSENEAPKQPSITGRPFKRVAVTGSTGFIGRHLVARLTESGVDVIAPKRFQGFDVARDDLPANDVDHVFHLAARTGVGEAWEDPAGFVYANTLGTVRVLDWCRRHRRPLTFVSAYVYGQPRGLPIAETHPVLADNPYAFSKFLAEENCRFYAEHYGLVVTILRPFNVYGPGQSDRFLLPHIARQIADPSCKEIVVKDLAPRRDYVFISDVVEAIFAAVGVPGSLFNIGSGVSYSVKEVIETACRAAGVNKPYRAISGSARRNEIDDVVADVSALSASTGWHPRVPLEEGLCRLVKAFQ